jgi:hypothetical protein
LASDAENPQKSTKKDSDNSNKKKGSKSSKSFFNNLKTSILGEYPIEDQVNKDDDDHKLSDRTEFKKSGKNFSNNTQKKSKEKDKKESNQINPDKKDKKESEQINSEEDPAIYFMNNLKDHKRVASLRKRKEKIIRVTASIISIILILIGIVYGTGRTQDVASNVIFGERAMFSVFLIMVGFLILAAVFASKLLEGRFLGNISKELDIVEGKNGKDQKNHTDQKTQNNNKKNK